MSGMDSLLAWAPEPIGSRSAMFVEGALLTLQLTAVATVLGLVVGLLMGLAKLSTKPWVRWPAEAYVWLLRGTPLLVQILFIYYALPALVPSLQLGEFAAAALGLGFNVGAYNAEVIRAGIAAIPNGQREAARSLGLSHFQSMSFVILPQAVRIVTPPLVNNIVALLKDSSLASSIGLLELTLAGNRISSETFLPVPVLTTVALLYLLQTTAITGLASLLERRLKLPGR
jgi:polar amino acid transport system permease protein